GIHRQHQLSADVDFHGNVQTTGKWGGKFVACNGAQPCRPQFDNLSRYHRRERRIVLYPIRCDSILRDARTVPLPVRSEDSDVGLHDPNGKWRCGLSIECSDEGTVSKGCCRWQQDIQLTRRGEEYRHVEHGVVDVRLHVDTGESVWIKRQ